MSGLFLIIIGITVLSFLAARIRSLSLENGTGERKNLASLPRFYGYHAAIWAGVPALLFLLVFLASEEKIIDGLLLKQAPNELKSQNSSLVLNDIKLVAASANNGSHNSANDNDETTQQLANQYTVYKQQANTLKYTLIIGLACLGGLFGFSRVKLKFRARQQVETFIKYGLAFCSTIAIATTVGIVFSVLFESILFFSDVPIWNFLFGTHWSPKEGDPTSFGVIPLLTGTLTIALIAMLVAVPIGLMSAIYLSEYAHPRFRTFAKPVLELLAGIPTVVYGFFAALTVGPAIRQAGELIGLSTASESALAVGFVMGIMIIPFVSSLSDDVITAVPKSLREGSLGLGATQSETIKKVVLPAALPGVAGSIILAVSRAIGETMIVVMAAGYAANLTANPFAAVTTITVQIVALLTGDQEFDSSKTLSAFALALLLFVITLLLNMVALKIVKKYREQYD